MVPVEPVSLSIGIIATADVCLKYFKEVVALCEAYQGADKDVLDFKIRIRAHSVRLEEQIKIVKSLVDIIDEEQLKLFHDIFERIGNLLRQVTEKWTNLDNKLSSLDPFRVKVARTTYAIYFKTSLETIMKSINNWHHDLDPLFYVLMISRHEKISQQMADVKSDGTTAASLSKFLIETPDEPQDPGTELTSIFKGRDYISTKEPRKAIAYSTSSLCSRSETTDHIIVDAMRVPEGIARERVLVPIRDLARKLERLGRDNTNFGLDDTGLLPCLGVIKYEGYDDHVTQIDFIFRLPKGFGDPRIRTLREILMDGEDSFPLDQRFELAKQISRAVMYLHIAKFVHKNVRPETILVFNKKPTKGKDEKRRTTTHAALVGFEKIRPDDTESYKAIRDDLWYKDMYRHPTRQGIEPVSKPLMQHDIYSLGVCLLEIGIWAPFVDWDKENSPNMGKAFSLWTRLGRQNLDEKSSGLVTLLENLNLESSKDGGNSEIVTSVDDWRKKVPTSALDLKAFFVSLATEVLPGRMGQKYSEIVRTCLTCLDEGNPDFVDLKDEDGIIIGTRYMDKISFQLQGITI